MPRPFYIRVVKWTRGNAIWDFVKEVVKLMLPVTAVAVMREWISAHSVALMATIAFIVALLIAFWDRKKRLNVNGIGLVVESAQWHCTIFPEAKIDVSEQLQGKVVGNTLQVHAHDNVLGDVCELHSGKQGHPKSLEVDFAYRAHATATHDEVMTITCSAESTREGQTQKTITPQPLQEPESPANVTIIEGAIAERRWNDGTNLSFVQVLLRVRVFALESDTRLDSWSLVLNFGDGPYSATDLDHEKLSFHAPYEILANGKQAPPPEPRYPEPRLNEISSREPLPVRSEVEGWLSFKVTDSRKTMDYVLGTDFYLSVYGKGKLCKTIMRPGLSRRRVII